MKFKRLLIYILIFILIMSGTTTFATTENNNLNIYSEAAILIDSNTGKVLYSKNGEQKMYPASTTKILTAILAIERGHLQDKTIVKNSAISVIPSGYASAYLSEGEEITIEYLLQAFLIHSANEAGNVLAEYISGSMEEFVNLMNQKALELGCTDTHFVNTNGIHDDNHYTTAQDLATITRYCMKNQTFRNIVSMKSCTIPKTNKSDIRKYKNTNALIDTSSSYYLEDCIGIKTGYTSQAKNCLISACNKDGLELIAVVLGSPTIDGGSSTRYIDSTTLYDYGYSNYKLKTIAQKNDIIQTIEVKNGNKDTRDLEIVLEKDISALVNVNNANLSYTIKLNDNLSAPISINSVVGTITYTSEGIEYTENLLALHDVYKNNTFIFILGAILALIIFIILNIIRIRIKIKKKIKLNKKIFKGID